MRKLKKAVYESPGDIEERVQRRLSDAAQMAPGPTRQSVLREIAQLRSYAEMKRCFLVPRRPAMASAVRPEDTLKRGGNTSIAGALPKRGS